MKDNSLPHTPFEALLDAAVDGIIVINHMGIIETINQAAEDLFGYSKGELSGQNISQLMPNPDSNKHNDYIHQYITTGIRKMIGIGRKTTGQKKNGHCFPMYLSVGHIDEPDRTCFVGIIRDLTEQENYNQAIRKGQQKIQQLQERLTHVSRISTIGEMATGIAHEINQPLTAIATYAQACQRMLLAGMTDTSELLDALGKIDSQAQRASKVITGIRQLSKKQAMVCADYNCVDLINEVVTLAEAYAHKNNISIQLDLTEISASQQVTVDIIQTQQVLLNLINNAIESMDSSAEGVISNQALGKEKLEGKIGETVIVKATDLKGSMIEIAVIDQGTGIDEKHQDQLFEAFFTTKPSGLGMGLSICQSIINTQGGQIYCEANADRGVTFSITLPISLGVNA